MPRHELDRLSEFAKGVRERLDRIQEKLVNTGGLKKAIRSDIKQFSAFMRKFLEENPALDPDEATPIVQKGKGKSSRKKSRRIVRKPTLREKVAALDAATEVTAGKSPLSLTDSELRRLRKMHRIRYAPKSKGKP